MTQQEIVRALKKQGTMTSKEITLQTGTTRGSVHSALKRMTNKYGGVNRKWIKIGSNGMYIYELRDDGF